MNRLQPVDIVEGSIRRPCGFRFGSFPGFQKWFPATMLMTVKVRTAMRKVTWGRMTAWGHGDDQIVSTPRFMGPGHGDGVRFPREGELVGGETIEAGSIRRPRQQGAVHSPVLRRSTDDHVVARGLGQVEDMDARSRCPAAASADRWRTSGTPRVVRAWMSERATREWSDVADDGDLQVEEPAVPDEYMSSSPGG